MNLTDLANHFGSDKRSTVRFAHRYTVLYDLLFSPLRDKPVRLLEMGLAIGGPDTEGGAVDRMVDSPSVRMWSEYFPHAELFGFDISDFSHLPVERFQFLRGDSGKEEDLTKLAQMAESFDIIIDDASHASYHQLLALKMLWPSLSAGGFYVIEDLHWQSPVFEASMPATPKAADVLFTCFERKQYLPNPVFNLEEMQVFLSEVATFAPFTAMDGSASPIKVIVLRKTGELRQMGPALKQ